MAADASRPRLHSNRLEMTQDCLHTVLLADGAGAAEIASAFIDAIAAHRHLSRDGDPPTK
jgi:hypothetical protein